MLKLLYFCITYIGFSDSAFMKNEHSIEVEKVEPCPNTATFINPIKNLKFVHYNRTHKVLNCDYSYTRQIDENVGGTMLMDRWADGGWKTVPWLGFQPNICKTMLRYFKTAWVNFHTKSGLTPVDRCPAPAGNYSLRNYIVDTGCAANIPFWSGYFRMTIRYEEEDTRKPLLCYLFYVRATEKY